MKEHNRKLLVQFEKMGKLSENNSDLLQKLNSQTASFHMVVKEKEELEGLLQAARAEVCTCTYGWLDWVSAVFHARCLNGCLIAKPAGRYVCTSNPFFSMYAHPIYCCMSSSRCFVLIADM